MSPLSGPELDRRRLLQAMAAGLVTSAGACSKPNEEIVPYIRMPERVLPGEPRRYATTLTLAGWGRGVHVITVDGRPIKIEGNPLHPASGGATDVFAEAAILDLYDPDRARTPTSREGGIASFEGFLKAYAGPLAAAQAARGRGFRLLTGPVTSPTLHRQIEAWLAAMPEAAWHVHDRPEEEGARAAAARAFGRVLRAVPRFGDADVVLALDADPLGPGPDQIRDARAIVGRRRAGGEHGFLRLYAVEPAPTLTGLKADDRLALAPHLMPAFAAALATALGAALGPVELPPEVTRFAQAVAADLLAHPGRALIVPGPNLPPDTGALLHWANARLAAPIDWIEPPDRPAGRAPGSLADLAADLDAGRVSCLVVAGCNPVYDAPADLALAERLARAPFSVHVGLHRDETAGACTWRLPCSHALESWSDARATDGTASIVQPLIRPLYGTRGLHEILSVLLGGPERSGYDLVRETWQSLHGGSDVETWWRRALHDGVVAESRARPAAVGSPKPPVMPAPAGPAPDLAVVLKPDPSLWDGSFANNAWLQECPKPITKQVWGNALEIGPSEAARRGLASGDVVRLATAGGMALAVPVAIVPGHAPGVASLALGSGRSAAGRIGNGVGVDAYKLATRASPRLAAISGVTRTSARSEVLTTQHVVRLDGDQAKLFPRRTLASLAEPVPDEPERPTLLAPWTGDVDGHAWGMVIDAASCIGCNACVVACQSENNVPVVGPEEIARGRFMHWLRVDLYEGGTPDAPQGGFQPVPCMQCEHAPCEPVCPVAASVHDGEGLNVQVYNRCIGTRFCEANCPYKVRRFNFFGYADGQEYANGGEESLKAQRNPNVTVRSRGVMEKCTYCVQRISRARQESERDDRPMADGAVVTACQSACPTQAITFGDLGQATSRLHPLRADPRHYSLLAELNTRPRTTYLADLRDPNPALAQDRT